LQSGIEKGQEEGEKGVLCLVRRGGRRNSKRKEGLKRRKTNDFNNKKKDKTKNNK
jgi:hypothetical protein